MNLIITGAPGAVINGPQGRLCQISSSSGLGTISAGSSPGLGNIQTILLAIAGQASLLTFNGTTAERNSAWSGSPAAGQRPPLGTGYFDTTLGAQLFAEAYSSSGWSSTTTVGV
jgi:hypothetical protein